MTHIVPSPYVVKGHSTLYDKDGKPQLQWVKTSLDNDKYQALMLEAIEALKEDIPRVSMIKPPPLGKNELLNCYVVTDYNLGMLSWGEETGADWDLQIAEELIIKWFAQAIQQSPDANTAVFAQLSDFLHFDGMDAVTPASKHLLDVDTRFSKLVRSAIRVIRTCIDMLLETIAEPDLIVKGWTDELIALKHYPKTVISIKDAVVIYKELKNDGFVITSFLTSSCEKLSSEASYGRSQSLKINSLFANRTFFKNLDRL
jgi:hypothetical protein